MEISPTQIPDFPLAFLTTSTLTTFPVHDTLAALFPPTQSACHINGQNENKLHEDIREGIRY
jgi:hypothetical protein